MQTILELAKKLLTRYEPQLIDLAARSGKSIITKLWRRYVAMAQAGTLPPQISWMGPGILVIDEEIQALPKLPAA